MHCRNKLIHGSKKYHAVTLTNDIASTIEVSTPAVMLGLSFANNIEKKNLLLYDAPDYFKALKDLKYFKCRELLKHIS